jgi:hypothetical protein
MDRHRFIHSLDLFHYHVAGRVDDILPALQAAVRSVGERAKEGVPAIIKRM